MAHMQGFCNYSESSVKLTPSPEALVKEGETLHLQCDYTGLLNPDFINWYLNNDTYGLVIDARLNRIQIKPTGYETERYTTSCNTTSFTLSIANISQAKDDGDKWECDVTIIGMHPPSKASTILKIIKAEYLSTTSNTSADLQEKYKNEAKNDDKSGSKFETRKLVQVISGISGGLVILIAAGCVIYIKKKKDGKNVINFCPIHRNSGQSCTQKEIDGDDFRTTKSDISDNWMPLIGICHGENQRIRVDTERPLNNQAILKNQPEKGNKLAHTTETDTCA